MTLAAAWPSMISRAMFGPVSAAAGWPGRTSLMTSVIRSSESRSRPFVRLTTGIHGWIVAFAASSVSRNPCDGTPTMSSSACATALSRSAVAVSLAASVHPARYVEFVRFSLISSATSGLRAHSIVVWRPATNEATVVPHEPAPSTTTCMAG